MYAIIETGGKQYKVEKDSVIYVEKLEAAENEEVIFDKVVAVKDRTLKVGKPYVKDAFVKGGAGFGATYARLWPMLRIDYIMVPDRFDALDCEIPRIGYSDHYPVVSTVEL